MDRDTVTESTLRTLQTESSEKKHAKQFVLYVICGMAGVSIDFSIYTLLLYAGVWYQTANVAGYAAGTVLSFLLNRWITFRVFSAPIRRLLSFFGVAFVGYLSSAATLWVLIEGAGTNPLLAKALGLIVVLAVQYTLNSLITFRPSAFGNHVNDQP